MSELLQNLDEVEDHTKPKLKIFYFCTFYQVFSIAYYFPLSEQLYMVYCSLLNIIKTKIMAFVGFKV